MSTVEQDKDLREPIRLPEIETLSVVEEANGGTSAIYGATAMAASYCGFKRAPSVLRGHWQHGWIPSYRKKLHAASLLGLRSEMKPEDYYWVARKDEEDYLRSRGYKNALAIGLPVVYLPKSQVQRRPGSLLVMPAHSIEYTTHVWKFEEYAESIAAIRDEFTEVVVCIHPSCWKRGYWVDAFRSRDFPLVKGALPTDRNALVRIQTLMSGFDYVTTNSFGSQLAYAAFFGAKTSVYGTFAVFREEDYKHDPFYALHPELLAPALEAVSENTLRKNCPQFFCHPREAKTDIEWGRFEVGEPNKVSPRRMRSLFGWSFSARAMRAANSRTPGFVKHGAKMALNRSYRETHRETQRLLAMPRHKSTSTTLLGPRLEVEDACDFLWRKRVLFDEELYRFSAASDAPRILVCGAGIGLSVCYFKRLYPKSRITAFEPDPRVFEVLKGNCESWGASDVVLVPEALWDREADIPFSRDDVFPGRIGQSEAGDDCLLVRTCRLRGYLSDPVDLLRLNIEGAEVDVLLDCADLLGQVRNLAVDYHSIFGRPQRLNTLMELLTKAGFRMEFKSLLADQSPFYRRIQTAGMDGKLRILAFRSS
jgi:FkbM family methyltransferase